MDPLVIAQLAAAIATIVRQLQAYSQGQLPEAELQAFHARVKAFLKAVQDDADSLRS